MLLLRAGGSWAICRFRLREVGVWASSVTMVSMFPFMSWREESVCPRRGEDAALSLAWAALLELPELLCWVDEVRGGATGGMFLRPEGDW